MPSLAPSRKAPRAADLRSFEFQRSPPLPESPAPNLENENQQERRGANPRLRCKAPCRPFISRPLDIEIANYEATSGAAEVNPRRHLARRLWISIEQIRIDTHTAPHDAEAIEAKAQAGKHVMPSVFKGEAKEEEACDYEGGGEVENVEACFGVEGAGVATGGEGGEGVVDVVARELAEGSGDNGDEVEIAYVRDQHS